MDWPRDTGIDTDTKASAVCTTLCTQMNAYAVLTQRWMGIVTSRVPAARNESAAYFERSATIRTAAQTTFAAFGEKCSTVGPSPSPPGPAPTPPPPNPTAVATCVNEWEADRPAHHHNSTGLATLNCGAGKVISDIEFANYGTATGSCALGFKADQACSADNSKIVYSGLGLDVL